jgi:hypothetical protein
MRVKMQKIPSTSPNPLGFYSKRRVILGRPRGSKNRPKTIDPAASRRKSPRTARVNTTEHKNSEPLTDEQQHHLLDQSARVYARALELKKNADAKFKLACKTIKSDGVKLADVKTYLEAETEEGQAQIRARVEAAARIARWRNFPIGTQFTLFLEDQTPSHSYTTGKEAGLAGLRAEAPSNANIEEWLEGWQAGQAILAGGIATTEDDDLQEGEAA